MQVCFQPRINLGSYSGTKCLTPGNRIISSQPVCDVVSFGSKDLLDMNEEDVFKKIEASIKPENFIGQGHEAQIYRIPDTNYCVRLHNLTINEFGEYFSKNISQEDKINHVVAKIGGNSSIMKYIDGYNAFIKQDDDFAKIRILKDIREMPVESFQNLLKQFLKAMNHNMLFDCCGSNIIINPKNKTLTAIDFYKNSPDCPEAMYPLSYMYSALTGFHDSREYKKLCANKILNAALNEVERTNLQCFDFANFDFSRLLKRINDGNLFPSENYYRLLLKLLNEIKDLKIEQYCTLDTTSGMYGKMKQARSLIKQLF